MRKSLMVAGLVVATLVPSLAFAQSCEQQHDNQAFGTIAGAGIGALVGATVAPRHDQAAGALVGAAGGAIVGNQVSRPDRDCAHAYGYYDRNSQWHAMATGRSDARGYYDRDGAWVDGPPNGFYAADGRWVVASDGASAGYYDDSGRWAPASSSGYYDDRGQWVSSASGHYEDGRWIAGHAAGAYDANGRWMVGARAGHTDEHGVWIADAQPGYYDGAHRWHAGMVRGYYDTRGVWVGAAASADTYGANSSYRGAEWRDLGTREMMLQHRIDAALAGGTIDRGSARFDRQQLDQIRTDEAAMRRDGRLSQDEDAQLQTRLDRLTASFRQSVHGAGF
jgi:hypothetical protein